MAIHRVADLLPKGVQCLRFGEDGLTQSARGKAALHRFLDYENDFVHVLQVKSALDSARFSVNSQECSRKTCLRLNSSLITPFRFTASIRRWTNPPWRTLQRIMRRERDHSMSRFLRLQETISVAAGVSPAISVAAVYDRRNFLPSSFLRYLDWGAQAARLSVSAASRNFLL
jgi:hypothetical protein